MRDRGFRVGVGFEERGVPVCEVWHPWLCGSRSDQHHGYGPEDRPYLRCVQCGDHLLYSLVWRVSVQWEDLQVSAGSEQIVSDRVPSGEAEEA